MTSFDPNGVFVCGCHLVQNRQAGIQGTFYGLHDYRKLIKSWTVTLNARPIPEGFEFSIFNRAENVFWPTRSEDFKYVWDPKDTFHFLLFTLPTMILLELIDLHGCESVDVNLTAPACLQSLLSNQYRHIVQMNLTGIKTPTARRQSVRYLAWLRSWTRDCWEQIPPSRNCKANGHKPSVQRFWRSLVLMITLNTIGQS